MRLVMVKSGNKASLPAVDMGDGTLQDISDLLKQPCDSRTDGTLDDIFRFHDPSVFREQLVSEINSLETIEADSYDVPLRNGDIICVGRNYAAHAKELNNPVPTEPVLFMKPRTCLLRDGGEIILHKDCLRVEYEGELALIIGKDIIGEISLEEAEAAIFGVTLLNDVTDRGKQSELKAAGKPWVAAKGRPTFAPCGPGIYMLNSYSELLEMGVETRVNGETRQRGTVGEWLWSPAQLIASIANTTGLHAGSIVATGTPSGVGTLAEGDRVEVFNDYIGTLANHVRLG
ncbi:fumarylacetoacetate hydrolase family protein [bacterium]|nr:fumarylacetoacetate hydrolase family protein [bacterium]